MKTRSSHLGPCARFLLALLACGAWSCSDGGGGASTLGAAAGLELEKPGGGAYISDPHQGGQASRLRLVEITWARLVDVHDVDAAGNPSIAPLYRDFAIHESVQSDGDKFLLSDNPLTQRVRLVCLRTRGAPDEGRGTFAQLLREARTGLPPVQPKDDDGSASPPFSFVARNAALVLRFDDLLQDGAEALAALPTTVRVLVGYPPTTPFEGRLFFDPNHGGVVDGVFHSTRVIVDCTVSELEAAAFPIPLRLNADGLPESDPASEQPNVALHLPARLSPGTGQFALLRSLAGGPLAEERNGPVDASAPTRDVVRALRAGNRGDTNGGYLLDVEAPALLGRWPLELEEAFNDPAGRPGIDWLVTLRFTTPCRSAPSVGDLCRVGAHFLEVSATGRSPNADGRVSDVRVRSLRDEPLASGFELVGPGELATRFERTQPVPSGCWVTFDPPALEPPQARVSPAARLRLQFSEALAPGSVSALEGLMLVRGDASFLPTAETIVPAIVQPAPDLRSFTLAPLLELAHRGQGEPYHLVFAGLTDLAGNALSGAPEELTFSIDRAAEPRANAGVVLRFDQVEELPPAEGRDLRGQFFYDLARGRIRPRPVTFQSASADRSKPVPSIMTPFLRGVQTPLSALGSKTQTLYRYCDFGWNVRDESKYDIDVVAIAWSPLARHVIRDFYEDFEIRLAHSRFLPDECLHPLARTPIHLASGLLGAGSRFSDNILNDRLSPQKVVHERSGGYSFGQADLFRGIAGIPLVSYPLNRGAAELASYTWRDTAVLARGGPNGAGIPLCIEAQTPPGLENEAGVIAPPGQVPSFGLPLLIEYRCYPTTRGLGLNPLDVSLAVNNSALPAFRAYSTGGTNRLGIPIRIEPDSEEGPQGGYNPLSTPPGKKTPFAADNTFYLGQIDYVARVSRVHTAWIDTRDASPDYLAPVLEPEPRLQPPGTRVAVEFRGASGFGPDVTPFDARTLNAYGEPVTPVGRQIDGQVRFHDGVRTWSDAIDALDGARYLQLRLSFRANLESGLVPELEALALAFSFD